MKLIISLLFLALTSACAAGLKDIRPQSVIDGPNAASQAKARALLERAAKNAGGVELLNRHGGFKTHMTDLWTNPMAKLMFLRYDAQQKIVVEAQNPRVDNVSISLVSGKKEGEVWGVKNDKVYRDIDGKREFVDDEITMLYVKNPAALVLLPLRLAYADRVSYLGPITHKGKSYESLFLTWESFEPNANFDQWIVWIDPETGDIAKAKFTIREYTGALVSEAVVELSEYTRFDDVVVPAKIKALFSLEGESIRTWQVEHFEWTESNTQTMPASQPQ